LIAYVAEGSHEFLQPGALVFLKFTGYGDIDSHHRMEVDEGRQQRKKHEQQHIDPQQVVRTLDGSIPGEARDCYILSRLLYNVLGSLLKVFFKKRLPLLRALLLCARLPLFLLNRMYLA
jgi:hypothetical protein